MWVANSQFRGARARIYAYEMATRARVPARDIDALHAAGNHDPSGIWSDGETMWVADFEHAKIYTYDMP